MTSDASAGTESGSTILKNTVRVPAPSISADSKRSLGSWRKKLASRYVENGRPYPAWASHKPIHGGRPRLWRFSGTMPCATKKVSTGTKVSWRGTASNPTKARKIQFRPGKFIQANAYAAKAAIVTGITVDGIAIMKLLKID